MDRDELAEYRRARDEFFRSHYASPIPQEHIEMFEGLSYFEQDLQMSFPGRFETDELSTVDVMSSAGTSSIYRRMGTLLVDVDGSSYRLTVLDDGDGNAFIPFRDATSGEETYAGGRYVDVKIAGDGSASIDFNRARNPYCVYDEEFVCPLPPSENWLSLPIRAGEKNYAGR